MARRGYVQLVFQSTLPLRGATAYRFSIDETLIISIHTPLAGSDSCLWPGACHGSISIHTPLAGSDVASGVNVLPSIFQSTLPLRGATEYCIIRTPYLHISIHTPLAGSDPTVLSCAIWLLFQSTLPLRGATRACRIVRRSSLFQSTLPLRGATR